MLSSTFIDDFGMRKLPLTAAEDLLEIIMRRYERVSTLLTSNRPVEDWGKQRARWAGPYERGTGLSRGGSWQTDVSAGSGSRPICQWCCQTRLEAWSQVPCAIQWLQPEAAPQADSRQKSTFLARLGLYLSRKDKRHVHAKKAFQSAR